MKNIEILNVTPEKVSGFQPDLARLYAEVFAKDPWYEYSRCPETQSFYSEGYEVGSSCPCCSKPLEEAYPLESTTENIERELSYPNPIAFLGFVENNLSAFSWGYQTTIEEMVSSKYKTEDMKSVMSSLLREYVGEDIFFGSETGVEEQVRGLGLATLMIEKRLQTARDVLNLPVSGRTNCYSPMSIIYKKLGLIQIMGPESIVTPNREIVKTGKIINNIIDTENPDRIFFIKNT